MEPTTISSGLKLKFQFNTTQTAQTKTPSPAVSPKSRSMAPCPEKQPDPKAVPVKQVLNPKTITQQAPCDPGHLVIWAQLPEAHIQQYVSEQYYLFFGEENVRWWKGTNDLERKPGMEQFHVQISNHPLDQISFMVDIDDSYHSFVDTCPLGAKLERMAERKAAILEAEADKKAAINAKRRATNESKKRKLAECDAIVSKSPEGSLSGRSNEDVEEGGRRKSKRTIKPTRKLSNS
jgi:hypothetical protein